MLEALDNFEKELGLDPLKPDTRARMLQAWTLDAKSHKRLDGDLGNNFNVLFTRVEAGGAWPGYEAFLSNEARRKIERIYAKDFAVYANFL